MIRDGVTIYFVRHGQTPWNAKGLAQGHSDIELNDHGREQARQNGQRLAQIVSQPDSLDFVASPLKRAKETMEILRANLGLPRTGYRLEPRIKEMGFGVREGTAWPAYAQDLLDAERVHGKQPWSWAAEGAESYADLATRALPFFREAARDSVVACHGGVSRCLLVALGGLAPAEAISMFIPQDKIMILRGTSLSWA